MSPHSKLQEDVPSPRGHGHLVVLPVILSLSSVACQGPAATGGLAREAREVLDEQANLVRERAQNPRGDFEVARVPEYVDKATKPPSWVMTTVLRSACGEDLLPRLLRERASDVEGECPCDAGTVTYVAHNVTEFVESSRVPDVPPSPGHLLVRWQGCRREGVDVDGIFTSESGPRGYFVTMDHHVSTPFGGGRSTYGFTMREGEQWTLVQSGADAGQFVAVRASMDAQRVHAITVRHAAGAVECSLRGEGEAASCRALPPN